MRAAVVAARNFCGNIPANHVRSRNWRRSINIVAGPAVLAVVALGVRQLGASTTPPSGMAPPPSVPVTAAVATRENVPEIVNAIGTVQSIDSVDIEPRITGTYSVKT